MKSTRIISLILAILFVFSLVSCGTLNPALNSDTNTEIDTSINTETETDTDTEIDIGFGEETGYSDTAFTVALRYKGEKYIPDEEIIVYWKKQL